MEEVGQDSILEDAPCCLEEVWPGAWESSHSRADTSQHLRALRASPVLNRLPFPRLLGKPGPLASLCSHFSDEEEEAWSGRRHLSGAPGVLGAGGNGSPNSIRPPRPACPSAWVWESLQGLHGPEAPGQQDVSSPRALRREKEVGTGVVLETDAP